MFDIIYKTYIKLSSGVIIPISQNYEIITFEGVVNSIGDTIIETKFKEIREMSTGFFVKDFDNKYGVISFTGKTIIPCFYDKIEKYLSEKTGDYFILSINSGDSINYGVASVTGNILLNCIWKKIKISEEGFIVSDKTNNIFYYSFAGKLINN